MCFARIFILRIFLLAANVRARTRKARANFARLTPLRFTKGAHLSLARLFFRSLENLTSGKLEFRGARERTFPKKIYSARDSEYKLRSGDKRRKCARLYRRNYTRRALQRNNLDYEIYENNIFSVINNAVMRSGIFSPLPLFPAFHAKSIQLSQTYTRIKIYTRR